MFASTVQEKMSEQRACIQTNQLLLWLLLSDGFWHFWLPVVRNFCAYRQMCPAVGSPSVLPYEVGLGWALSPPVYRLFSDVPLLDREGGVIWSGSLIWAKQARENRFGFPPTPLSSWWAMANLGGNQNGTAPLCCWLDRDCFSSGLWPPHHDWTRQLLLVLSSSPGAERHKEKQGYKVRSYLEYNGKGWENVPELRNLRRWYLDSIHWEYSR